MMQFIEAGENIYLNVNRIISIQLVRDIPHKGDSYATVMMTDGQSFRVDDVDKFFARLQRLNYADFY